MKGTIQKRGKNSWRIEISTGRQPDGTYGKIRETVRGTKKDAEARLAELLVELNRNDYVKESNQTLTEFADEWLKHVKTQNEPNTYKFYYNMWVTYIRDRIGHLKLNEIRSSLIQELVDDIKDELSASTAKHVKSTLSSAFNYAVTMDKIKYNPVQNVKVKKARVRKVKKDEVWTVEEVKKVLNACKDERYWIFFWLGLKTGMRPQEIYALKRGNVDLINKTITINEAIKSNDKDGVVFGDTKTSNGCRTIPIDDDLVRALKRHLAKQNEERLKLGVAYNDLGLVLANPEGRPVNDKQIRKVIKRVAEKAGVKYIPPKNLRHTHATLLLSAGVHPKIVSERLGHSQISITLDIYSFAMPNLQRDAVNELEAMLSL